MGYLREAHRNRYLRREDVIEGDVGPVQIPGLCDRACGRRIRGSLWVSFDPDAPVADLEDLRCVTHVADDVEIRWIALPDLGGLRNLREIGGLLRITDVEGPVDLAGLEQLESVEALAVVDNPDLRSVAGLERLAHASAVTVIGPALERLGSLGALRSVRSLEVGGPELRALDGLTALEEVTGWLGVDETALSDLEGLEALRVVGDGTLPLPPLRITDNPVLGDLRALHGLVRVQGGLRITGNPSLPEDEIDALLLAIDELTGTVTVEGNAPPP